MAPPLLGARGAKSLPAPCPSGGLKSFGKLQKTTSMYGRPSPSGVSAASTSVGSDSTAAASMVGDENIVLDGIDSSSSEIVRLNHGSTLEPLGYGVDFLSWIFE